MAGSLGDLLVRVGVDVAGLEANLSTGLRSINTFVSDAGKAFKPMDRFGDNLASIATPVGAALTALTGPLALASGAAVTLAGDFEASFNRIKANVDGITAPALGSLRDLAIDLGAKTAFSAQQAADGMGVFAQAGFSAEQIIAAMPGTLNLAAAGTLAIGDAATLTKDILGEFSLKAGDSSHVADVLATASSLASGSMGELGTTLQYVGPVAKGAGLSLEETVSAIVALDSAGIRGSSAGTSLRGVLASLEDPSSKAAEVLSDLNVSLTDANGQVLPFSNVLDQLKTGLNNVQDPTAKQRDLFQLFGREAATAAQVLIEQGSPALNGYTEKLNNSQGAAERMATTINTGFKYALDQVKGSIETAGITLGTVLQPAFEGVLNAGTELVNEVLIPGINWFGQLPKPVQDAAIAVGAVATAVGPLLLGVGTLLPLVTGMVPAFAGIAGALGLTTAAAAPLTAALVGAGAALSGVGLAVGAVAAAWVLWKYQDDIPGFGLLRGAFDLLKESLGLVWDVMSSVASTAVKYLVPSLDSIKATLNLVLAPLNALGAGLDWVAGKVHDLRKPFDDSKESVKGWNETGKASVGVLDTLEDHLPKTTTAIKDHNRAAKDAKQPVKDFSDAGKDLALKLSDVITNSDRSKQSVDLLKGEFEKSQDPAVQLYNAFTDFDSSLKASKTSIDNVLPPIGVLASSIIGMTAPTISLQGALHDLGVKSATDLGTVAENAARARDAVLGSNEATDFEKKSAIYKAMQAQVDYAKVAGQAISDEQTATLKRLGDELSNNPDGGLAAQKGKWSTFSSDVTGILGGFTTDIGKQLFSGDFSFGGQAQAMLKTLGDSAYSLFVKPATDAINTFITTTITDLLSGKGFGGVLSRLGDIGSSVSGIFGGATSGASDVIRDANGNILSTVGSGAGGAGGIAGAVGSVASSGVTAIVGAVASVGTLISSVIGNFQNARQENTLNAIEGNTRISSVQLRDGIQPTLNQYLPNLDIFRDFFYNVLHADLIDMTGRLYEQIGILENIRSFSIQAADNLTAIAQRAGPSITVPVTVQGNVIGNRDFIDQLADAVTAKVLLQVSRV